MGREANCECTWSSGSNSEESGLCKVLLETHELIVRGPIRRRIPISAMTGVSVDGSLLLFHVGEGRVSLALGATIAQSWAKKIATPPPSLAAKLGISPTTKLCILGELDSEELKAAIAEAGSTGPIDANLILTEISTAAELNHRLNLYAAHAHNPPLWVVYRKGANSAFGETVIRETLRRQGFIDTKVASVSPTLTALRFLKRT